nr:MAG TPA: hypothetical protein [Caudoviricetes sp.]
MGGRGASSRLPMPPPRAWYGRYTKRRDHAVLFHARKWR